MAMAADSSSPNEAITAARQARSIMDKYQIDLSDLREKSEFSSLAAGQARKRVPGWEQAIAITIADLNDCVVSFDSERKFLFKGFDEDTQVASFMFFYITESCKRALKTYKKSNPNAQSNTFKNYFAQEIDTKVKKILEERSQDTLTESGKSLIAVKKQLVEERFGKADYVERKTSHKFDPHSALAGTEAGKKVNLVTGVHSERNAHAALA